MGQFFRFHGLSVQRPRHDHEGTVAALRRALAEAFLEIQQLAEGRPTAHVHDALVILGSFRRVAVGTIFPQFVGKIAAGHVNYPAARFLRRLPDHLPQPVVVLQGQAGKPDAHQLEIGISLPDEIQRHHHAVIQFRFPLPLGPRGEAVFLRDSFDGFHQFSIVFLFEPHLGGVKPGEASFGAPAGGNMKIVRVHGDMGAGNHDGFRFQGRNGLSSLPVRGAGGFDLFFAAPAHFGHDQRRMGHHKSRDDGHRASPLIQLIHEHFK